ncbi:PH domain-containing protein [Lysobacter sp. A421]
MGLFDGLLGNASKIDNAAIQQEFAQVLAPGEVVEHACKLIRDYFDPEDLHQETEHLRGAVGACRVCFELSAQVASVKNRAARLASILIHPVVVMEIAATVAGGAAGGDRLGALGHWPSAMGSVRRVI